MQNPTQYKARVQCLCLSVLLATFNINVAFGDPIYTITRSVTNIGGGKSLSLNYSILSSIGNVAIDQSTSSGYILNNGFLANSDLDGDGISDDTDNCLLLINPHQLDTDADLLGDVCDPDDDNDGLDDVVEATLGTDPLNSDSDNDGLTDFEEVNADSNPGNYQVGIDSDPNNPDTDADGLEDGSDSKPLTPYHDGDLAPYGNPDGIINAADMLIATRILLGDIIPTAQDINHGDIYPDGAPDGVINISDIILLKLLVLNRP